jgi:hypothetical protein
MNFWAKFCTLDSSVKSTAFMFSFSVTVNHPFLPHFSQYITFSIILLSKVRSDAVSNLDPFGNILRVETWNMREKVVIWLSSSFNEICACMERICLLAYIIKQASVLLYFLYKNESRFDIRLITFWCMTRDDNIFYMTDSCHIQSRRERDMIK